MNNKIEFDSQDKCVKCGALRPLFKTHCQTESCKELRRRPKKTINQQIEQSLNKLTHKTGRLSIRTNSNGAKHYNEGGNDELAMSKSIPCKNIDDIVQQIQNTLDYSNSLQELFKSDLKMTMKNVIISVPDNWITYITVNYKYPEQELTIGLIYA